MYNLEELDEYAERGWITRRDQGDLSIYNYTKKTEAKRRWNEVTLHARGVIMNRSTGEVVAWPFRKFFNYGEPGIELEIPEHSPDSVTVKLDGSLGILYRSEGKVRWATRGSFDSPHAQAGEAIWARRYAGVEVPENWTVLTEIIHPITRVIVPYDFEDMIVIGIRDRYTGKELTYEEMREYCEGVGLPITERIEASVDTLAERLKTLHKTEEGFVVRWGDHRVKVKGAAYLSHAKLLRGLSERGFADLWYAKKTSLSTSIPEEFWAQAEATFARCEERYQELQAEFDGLMEKVRDLPEPKLVAQTVKPGHKLFREVMNAYKGKPADLRRVAYVSIYNNGPRDVTVDKHGAMRFG